VHVNPSATCDRFEGGECAGDLATALLTVDQSFCIPGFAANLPGVGNVSLCQGMRCNPSDTTDGCRVTFVSTGLPASEPAPDVLRVQGRVSRITGSVPFTGVVPIPGGGTLPLSCTVTLDVGRGLPIDADLALSEETMCGTDRNVRARTNVDLSMLRVRLSGTGLNSILCATASALLAGRISQLFTGLEPALETGINLGINALDCGTCGADCPAELICRVP
jgi:hypothetical protein